MHVGDYKVNLSPIVQKKGDRPASFEPVGGPELKSSLPCDVVTRTEIEKTESQTDKIAETEDVNVVVMVYLDEASDFEDATASRYCQTSDLTLVVLHLILVFCSTVFLLFFYYLMADCYHQNCDHSLVRVLNVGC